MNEATDTERQGELEAIKQQLALLQQENAATRIGWLKWMRATGLLLVIYAAAILVGVLKSHGNIETNPAAIAFLASAIFLGASGLWCLLWSFRAMFEKLMKTA